MRLSASFSALVTIARPIGLAASGRNDANPTHSSLAFSPRYYYTIYRRQISFGFTFGRTWVTMALTKADKVGIYAHIYSVVYVYTRTGDIN